MKTAIFAIVAGVLGIVLGIASALYFSGLLGRGNALAFADVSVDGWNSDWSIGAPSASPYVRARIARHGLLALAREEAVYFTRNHDDAGRPLAGNCTYRLSGTGQDAFWWSITLYDAASRLPMNEDEALSIDATRVRGAQSWQATISPLAPPDDSLWISSRGASQFDLTLRLYRPSAAVLSDPDAHINPPGISRIGCAGEGS